jgi:formylglycine-generating enzyme required for sulfatase activity
LNLKLQRGHWNAKNYVAWLSRKAGKAYRPLSEAQFDYAARACSTPAYPWGDGKENANCNNCGSRLDYQQQTSWLGFHSRRDPILFVRQSAAMRLKGNCGKACTR